MSKKQLEQRLKELKAELEAGQKVLTDLEMRQASIRETMQTHQRCNWRPDFQVVSPVGRYCLKKSI